MEHDDGDDESEQITPTDTPTHGPSLTTCSTHHTTPIHSDRKEGGGARGGSQQPHSRQGRAGRTPHHIMTRGNQREIDRQRAANRAARGRQQGKEGDPTKRREA